MVNAIPSAFPAPLSRYQLPELPENSDWPAMKLVILVLRSIIVIGEELLISAAEAHHPTWVSDPIARDMSSPSSPINTTFPWEIVLIAPEAGAAQKRGIITRSRKISAIFSVIHHPSFLLIHKIPSTMSIGNS
jgi:hypothetical protein